MASRPFRAAYSGECGECFEEFDAGDEIRYNDESEIVGQDCCGHAYDPPALDPWRC